MHQFPCFSRFLPKCDFEQPSNDLAAFLGFVCHFFDVGAIQNPIKQTLVAEAVPGHIFNMLLQKILPKMTPKEVSFSSGCKSFWKEFEASLSFYTLCDKVASKASKRTS